MELYLDPIRSEIIKAMVAGIVSVLAYYRQPLFNYISRKYMTMRDIVSSTKKGFQVIGSPEFQKIPGTIEQIGESVTDLHGRVAKIEKNIGPNGGSSLLDGVNALRVLVSDLQVAFSTMLAKDREVINAMGLLMWKSDAEGKCIWASDALQRLVGFSFEDGFRGNQWENLYFPEDFANIKRRWQDAINTPPSNERNPTESELIMSARAKYRHATTGEAIPVFLKVVRLPDRSIIGVVFLVTHDDEHKEETLEAVI